MSVSFVEMTTASKPPVDFAIESPSAPELAATAWKPAWFSARWTFIAFLLSLSITSTWRTAREAAASPAICATMLLFGKAPDGLMRRSAMAAA